jgi:hypothetical protein
MSIKSELNNTKHYLRESRKAILGRGGEISEKAGLKDIPEAVWSIPADTSLAFREDSEVAYEKVVPVGAEEYALVKSLGGMTYKDEETQTLRDTKPTSLESRGANSAEPIDTLELPENIEQGIKKAYEDAGIESDVCWGLGINAENNNHIEIRNGRIFYRQMLGDFDLANVKEWKRQSTYGYFYSFPTISPAMKDLDFKVFARNIVPIGLSSKYEMVSINNSISSSLDKVICYGVTDTKYINIRDSAYTDVDTFKEAMKGVKLVYALETPIETDITHLFTNTSPFLKVQGGGGVVANNERKEAVPSTLKYTIKVG